MSEADQADILTPPEEVPAEAPPAPPEEFPFVTLPPQVSFLSQQVPPPGWLYITPDDSLTIRAWTALTGVTLAFDARVLFPDGRIGSYWDRYALTGGVAENSFEIRLAEGFLLSLWIRPTTTVPVGGCWVQCILQRGGGAAATQVQLIAAGYATTRAGLAWPYPRYQNPVEGPGRLRRIKGTDPGPGNIIMEYVPSGTRWKLISLFCTFTTSATAGNRAVYLYFLDSLGLWLAVPPGVLQPASSVAYYTWSIGVQNYAPAVALYYAMPLPADLYLQAGADIMVAASGMQAGDDFSAPQLLVEEWVEP
jgi:hypothetical protein